MLVVRFLFTSFEFPIVPSLNVILRSRSRVVPAQRPLSLASKIFVVIWVLLLRVIVVYSMFPQCETYASVEGKEAAVHAVLRTVDLRRLNSSLSIMTFALKRTILKG